jgi:hypothetical protein
LLLRVVFAKGLTVAALEDVCQGLASRKILLASQFSASNIPTIATKRTLGNSIAQQLLLLLGIGFAQISHCLICNIADVRRHILIEGIKR